MKLRKFASFSQLPWLEKLMVVEAMMLLFIARMLIIFVPFSSWNRFLTINRDGGTTDPEQTDNSKDHADGRQVGRIVRMAARNAPFKAVCLPQAMAAQWMLSRRRIKSSIVFGAGHGQENKSYDLHAWLVSENNIITGRREHERFRAFVAQSYRQDSNAPEAGMQ